MSLAEPGNLAVLGGLVAAAGMLAATSSLWTNAVVRLVWCFKRPFNVGEMVNIGARSGTVERLGWQAVYLRSSGGERVAIPNRIVLAEPIVQMVSASGAQGVEMRLPLPAGVEPAAARHAAQEAVLVTPYLDLERRLAVSLEQEQDGQIWVRVQAGIFDAGLRAAFETAVIENYRSHLPVG